MLMFRMSEGDSAIIDLRKFGMGLIKVVARPHKGEVKVGFEADRSIPIHRESVFLKIEEAARAATS
jgi:sRNA-binding carbon storage regulator CsrA